MKNKKTVIALGLALAIIIVAFAALFIMNRPEAEKGNKTISVTVVFSDKSEKDYSIKTDAQYLGDALLQEKLVTEEEYSKGYYTVIADQRADYNLDKSWWCVAVNGEMTNVGINQQPISDGDEFEITNTPA